MLIIIFCIQYWPLLLVSNSQALVFSFLPTTKKIYSLFHQWPYNDVTCHLICQRMKPLAQGSVLTCCYVKLAGTPLTPTSKVSCLQLDLRDSPTSHISSRQSGCSYSVSTLLRKGVYISTVSSCLIHLNHQRRKLTTTTEEPGDVTWAPWIKQNNIK